MARGPQKDRDDPRVTDLRAYRRERERQAKARKRPSAPQGEEPFLGRRKNAALFLVLVIAVLAALAYFNHRL